MAVGVHGHLPARAHKAIVALTSSKQAARVWLSASIRKAEPRRRRTVAIATSLAADVARQ
jgi:hypothetical protein